ncbi:MAG: hypothetical protein BAJALOKI3v1_900014 [Promethearchaeota archaeon]|jgi:hypothetical protein|nr:MAG: hypothetical protein BAJALOKI3v1_900014 [Candidatus Lokiarchaeota archaeon]
MSYIPLKTLLMRVNKRQIMITQMFLPLNSQINPDRDFTSLLFIRKQIKTRFFRFSLLKTIRKIEFCNKRR